MKKLEPFLHQSILTFLPFSVIHSLWHCHWSVQERASMRWKEICNPLGKRLPLWVAFVGEFWHHAWGSDEVLDLQFFAASTWEYDQLPQQIRSNCSSDLPYWSWSWLLIALPQDSLALQQDLWRGSTETSKIVAFLYILPAFTLQTLQAV